MIKIYSWNVNGIRAVFKKGAWDQFINEEKPDIICLQEIKAYESQINFLPKDYIFCANPAQKAGYSGTAILTKKQPINIEKNFNEIFLKNNTIKPDIYGEPNNEGRVITAEFADFFLVSVYTPNAKDDLSRLNLRHTIWDPIFLKYLTTLNITKPVIVGGDFNVAHNEIDLANPISNKGKKGFTTEERTGFDNFLQAGFEDTFRLFNKDSGQYTWWSHFANSRVRNVGWRIDYILASKQITSRILQAQIHPQILGSDHCPISITLDMDL